MVILTVNKFAALCPEHQAEVHDWLTSEGLLERRVTRVRILSGTAVEVVMHRLHDDGSLDVQFDDYGQPQIAQAVEIHECKDPPPWRNW
jgi:hypothetical protein